MKLIASLTLLCGPLAAATPHALDKRDIFVPSWEMEVTPGGPTVVVSGTIQEVHARMLELNPNWNEDFGINTTHLSNSSGLSTELSTGLEKRTDWQYRDYFCYGWKRTNVDEVLAGIRYLRTVPGRPRNDAGPGKCGRVSCSWWASIYWCNDDDKPKTLESFGSIADGAAYIFNNCHHGLHLAISGQAFHETKWNVIIRWDFC
ncbi:hypothetical protein CDD81_5047 [Ophiocordyceps australis]|uniref:Ecp2 effector protein domain-containing protein n=1 Tax=Ophiocordyceps australis TaxID=1399860 RepID=A0A2C5YAR8_9HYPO|nr:hypothetical protein CDD81_5047 [Ophiocordyceps australis]